MESQTAPSLTLRGLLLFGFSRSVLSPPLTAARFPSRFFLPLSMDSTSHNADDTAASAAPPAAALAASAAAYAGDEYAALVAAASMHEPAASCSATCTGGSASEQLEGTEHEATESAMEASQRVSVEVESDHEEEQSAPDESAVQMEDELTKPCSSCLEDQPLSLYSSAQLKKKGKRVYCIAKKAEAVAAQVEAARKEAMRSTFEGKLNAVMESPTPLTCLCCNSRQAVRVAACPRCTGECCSVSCFMRHKCDVLLECRRTMPKTVIPLEDRLHPDGVAPLWEELVAHVRHMPTKVPVSAWASSAQDAGCEDYSSVLDDIGEQLLQADWASIFSSLEVNVHDPFWRPDLFTRLRGEGAVSNVHDYIAGLTNLLFGFSELSNGIMHSWADAHATIDDVSVHSSSIPRYPWHATSGCLLPNNRLLHKADHAVHLAVSRGGSGLARSDLCDSHGCVM